MIKLKYKLISAAMLAAPLLVNTGIATTVHACANTQPISYSQTCYSFDSLEAKLNALVAEGVISKAQETSILDQYYYGRIGSRANLDAELDALISSGVIPHGKKAPILNAFAGWGSNWYIAVPNSGGHSTSAPLPNGINHNTPLLNGISHSTPQPNAIGQPSGINHNTGAQPSEINHNGGNLNKNTSKPSGSKANVQAPSGVNQNTPQHSKTNR
ncbi:hypothetical protein ACJDU8_21530 [Clostridium sp. WILCCON 0269]|uniref:Uncharacterized protein n=1 Tax=Candidatus Clostridium eludens TaxID=3381663 RepID=A0ABW8SPW6_9CLOT